ncbi:MAG: hypothetical protein [Caudoviricetes sp.]|nr:MAG: hypothetical protein [Caudoviricetes sp.]
MKRFLLMNIGCIECRVSSNVVGSFPGIDPPQLERLCVALTALTSWRIDWHYLGGRPVVKALPPKGPTNLDEARKLLHDMSIALAGYRVRDVDTPRAEAIAFLEATAPVEKLLKDEGFSAIDKALAKK